MSGGDEHGTPRNPDPNIPRLEGIRDDQGQNRFAEDPVIQATTPAADGQARGKYRQPYQVDDYVETESPHGSLILLLGLLALPGVFGPGVYFVHQPLGLMMIVWGMAAGLAAWVLGHSDLRAMAAGAMPTTQKARIQVGYRLGVIATLLGLVMILYWIVSLFWSILTGF